MSSPLKNQPPLNIARFTGFFIECVLTGIYWVHFYLYIESVRRRSKSVGKNLFKTPMFAVGATLFVTATGHFLILVISSFIALVNCVTTDTPQDQRGYLSLSTNWITAYSAIYIAIPVVADAFLIYRLFIVWDRNLLITIPAACLCVALLITESVAAKLFRTSVRSIFAKSRRWLVAAFALTFACNIYCTFLIALRVWLAQRRVRDMKINRKSKLQKYIEILIQSAALYCLLACLSLVFSVIESNAVYITIAATSPVIGICFCMIVTRPYNAEIQQTIGAITSVQHPWHGNNVPLDGAHVHGLRNPFSASSLGMNEMEGRIPDDPEKTLSGNDGMPEMNHVLGRKALGSALNNHPAIKSSDGAAPAEEKISVVDRSVIG